MSGAVKMEIDSTRPASSNDARSDAMDTSAANAAAASTAGNAAAADSSAVKADPAAATSGASGDAPSTRDEYAKTEEERGIISFPVVYNDGAPDHNVALIGLKNIFSAQLPKMPKEYIVRLVMDRKHRSMCIMKKTADGKQKVIGGQTTDRERRRAG